MEAHQHPVPGFQTFTIPCEGPEPPVAVHGAMGVLQSQGLTKGAGGPHLREDGLVALVQWEGRERGVRDVGSLIPVALISTLVNPSGMDKQSLPTAQQRRTFFPSSSLKMSVTLPDGLMATVAPVTSSGSADPPGTHLLVHTYVLELGQHFERRKWVVMHIHTHSYRGPPSSDSNCICSRKLRVRSRSMSRTLRFTATRAGPPGVWGGKTQPLSKLRSYARVCMG